MCVFTQTYMCYTHTHMYAVVVVQCIGGGSHRVESGSNIKYDHNKIMWRNTKQVQNLDNWKSNKHTQGRISKYYFAFPLWSRLNGVSKEKKVLRDSF